MKFNKKNTIQNEVETHPDVTFNEEGGIAFKTKAKLELVLRVISSFVSEDSFYKKGKELSSDLIKVIATVLEEDPEFVLKLALYARTTLHLRNAPIILMGEYAMVSPKRVPNARKYITATIQRVDEITELIAYVMEQNKLRKLYTGKLPIVIKHGIAGAFNKFDSYQFAKYNRDGAVKLRDAMFLSHPVPKNSTQEKVFKNIAEDTLPIPETWETYISMNGSTKKNWEYILPKMGYMALIRNLRNFITNGVDLSLVVDRLTNEHEIEKSKQFPYRFYSAYKEIEHLPAFEANEILYALTGAIDIAVKNVPKLTGTTLVVTDVSGSMRSPPSVKSKINMDEIGCLMAAVVKKKTPESITAVFATDFKLVPTNANDTIFSITEKLHNTSVGYSTEAYLIIKYLNDNNIKVDRIIIFSDMQCYGGSLAKELIKYRRNINKDVYVYSIDLAGYGTVQVPDSDTKACKIGGFSEKILSFIPMFESSKEDILSEIDKVSI